MYTGAFWSKNSYLSPCLLGFLLSVSQVQLARGLLVLQTVLHPLQFPVGLLKPRVLRLQLHVLQVWPTFRNNDPRQKWNFSWSVGTILTGYLSWFQQWLIWYQTESNEDLPPGAQPRSQSWGSNSVVWVIIQNKIRMVYPVSCTAVCSYVKSWGGPSKFWGSGPPNPPSGCALACHIIKVHRTMTSPLNYTCSVKA